jgi:hypothetical protein
MADSSYLNHDSAFNLHLHLGKEDEHAANMSLVSYHDSSQVPLAEILSDAIDRGGSTSV